MKNYIDGSVSFSEYVELIDNLLEQRKTTGENQSAEMFNYGKLNRQRIKRLEKTVKLSESLKQTVKAFDRRVIWLIITEGWCGDAAQNIPIIEKIAAENPKIETRYVLRDENLDLMDKFLTNNARSIPKLICLDAELRNEIGVWGPRPNVAMSYFYEMRESGMAKPEMMENLQRWYISDKEQSIQIEFEELLKSWTNQKVISANSAN